MKFVLGIILLTILLMSGLGYDVNYAEARLSTDPCSFKDYGKEMTKFLKISYDPSGVGKHVCKTTLEVWGIDKPVPARCGIVAGLYLTDPACKPEPDTEPESEPVAKLDSDNDGISNSIESFGNAKIDLTNEVSPSIKFDKDESINTSILENGGVITSIPEAVNKFEGGENGVFKSTVLSGTDVQINYTLSFKEKLNIKLIDNDLSLKGSGKIQLEKDFDEIILNDDLKSAKIKAYNLVKEFLGN